MSSNTLEKDIDYSESDYSKTLGDLFLAVFKKSVRNAELRHNLLPSLARIKSFNPTTPRPGWEIETHIKFKDKSVPLQLSSPIILAAGGNKSGENLCDFYSLGIGAVTVGSATSKAIEGNPYRPRLHLLPRDRAVINAMGLNNPGIEKISEAVDLNLGKCHRHNTAVGISVAETPGLTSNEEKIKDVLYSFRKAYRVADYIEINVSCPNTGSQRTDWHTDYLSTLLGEVMNIRSHLAPRKAVYVKLSPDMAQKSLETTLDIINQSGVTGLVLFNTFPVERSRFLGLQTSGIPQVSDTGKKGGVSGRPLFKNTLPAVKWVKSQLPNLSILACGGVDHGAKVLELLQSGADAVQCYSVLAYRWNAIHKMNRELLDAMTAKGIASIEQIHD